MRRVAYAVVSVTEALHIANLTGPLGARAVTFSIISAVATAGAGDPLVAGAHALASRPTIMRQACTFWDTIDYFAFTPRGARAFCAPEPVRAYKVTTSPSVPVETVTETCACFTFVAVAIASAGKRASNYAWARFIADGPKVQRSGAHGAAHCRMRCAKLASFPAISADNGWVRWSKAKALPFFA